MKLTRLIPFAAVALLAVTVLVDRREPIAVADPAPRPREAAPPTVTLPPDELAPHAVFRFQEIQGADWGVVRLKAPDAWATTKGKGVKVAVLDTGCDTTHPDLAAAVLAAKDFSGSPFGATDKQGHGTHTAGSIGARGPLPGCAPECSLLVGKVLGDQGSGSVVWIANGITWATDQGADVISMSLGGDGADSFMPPALQAAEAAGVIVICAAGNSGPNPNTCGYPGRYPQSVCVAAVDSALGTAGFSSRCAEVYIAGPGVNVRSTYPGGQYATMSGTSMATPNIAGVAALWVAAHPEVPKKDRPAAFRKALQDAAADLAPAGRDTATGYGFPDAVKLVAGSGPKPPDPGPGPGPTPPPCPMPPTVKVELTLDDLTPSGLRKILDATKRGVPDVAVKW